MPLYDYECQSCAHVVEVMHSVNDAGPAACERCGGKMRKLMSTPAIVFKGSGWAKKDARSAGSAGASKSATDTDSDTPAPASATTDPAGPPKDAAPAGAAGKTAPAAKPVE